MKKVSDVNNTAEFLSGLKVKRALGTACRQYCMKIPNTKLLARTDVAQCGILCGKGLEGLWICRNSRQNKGNNFEPGQKRRGQDT